MSETEGSSVCRRCGRPLKNLHSRRRGYGPVCYQKVFGKTTEPRRRARKKVDLDILRKELDDVRRWLE